MDENKDCADTENSTTMQNLHEVSECLQDILTAIDRQERAVAKAKEDQNKSDEPPRSVITEEDASALRLRAVHPLETPKKRSGGLESVCTSLPLAAGSQVITDSLFESFLPHEGPRWRLLRDKMWSSPQFQKYAMRTQVSSQWSIDEAFISFCLDRVEESLVLPTVIQKTNKTTRRKGQPRKYERMQADDSSSILELEEHYAEAFYLAEESEEDVLSMDDNPSDLDYEPVSIIRYKSTPTRKLPRRSSSRKSRDEVMPVATETMSDATDASKVVEIKPKPAKPKKKVQKSPLSPKTDSTTPRKRGRPRKNPTDPPKVRGKIGRPPLTEEQRMAKRKAYNDSRTRTRLEVIRDALPKILHCKSCVEQFTETEAMIVHHFEVHRQQEVSEEDRQNPASAYRSTEIKDIATVLRECPTCKEYVENMTRHNRKHQKRNFICEECGKFYVTRIRLKLHKRIHTMDRTGERLHCDKCDKSYRCISSLQRHQLIHGDKKTFICDQCGKDFFNSVRLRVHRAVHMKDKPYKCPDCGRGFTQLTNLRSHQRVHTGAKPYKCDLCPDSFTHKVSMKMHKKKKHGVDWWKENGIQVEDRKTPRKKTGYKKAMAKETMEKEMASMKTFVDQQQSHMDEAVRNYEFVSNLITHGSKTYAQLERKTNMSEAFHHPIMNPFENQWHS